MVLSQIFLSPLFLVISHQRPKILSLSYSRRYTFNENVSYKDSSLNVHKKLFFMVLILLINEVLLCKYCFKFKICFYLSLKISSSSYFRTQETGSHYQVRDRKLFQPNVHRWKRILLVFQLREKKVVINMYILRLIHPSDLKLMPQIFQLSHIIIASG